MRLLKERIICSITNEDCIFQYLCREGRKHTGRCPYMWTMWEYFWTVGYVGEEVSD